MSFTDNPVIAGLGNALGLGGLFADMKGAPAPDPAAAPPVKAGITKPNIPNYRERPYIPRNEMGSTSKGPGSSGGGPAVPPGPMSQETLQDPKVQTLLGQYGVTPSSQPPDPNLFVHNPEAFQKHPILSALLERGLGSLAYAHPGNGFMDSFEGSLRGNQEYEAARATSVNNQLMAPIQQAQAIGGLQHMNDEHTSALATQAHEKAMDDYYKSTADSKAAKAAQVAPRKNEDGSWSTWNPDLKQGEGDYEVNPNMGRDEEIYQKNAYFNTYAKELADKNHNGDLSALSHEELAQIHQDFETMQSMSKGASAQKIAAGHDATKRATAGATGANRAGKLSDTQKAQISELNRRETEINTNMNSLNNKELIFDDDRNPLIPGSAKTTKYISDKKGQLENIRAQRDALLGNAPAPALNPVPFTQGPSVRNNQPQPAHKSVGRWDPTQKKVVYY